jgi:DNA topoisomerase-2
MKYISVKSVKSIKLPFPVDVYDLTVSKNHNFQATFDNIIVHNCTHYSHGEGSMAETIVGLAQNFPGSNNINLLEPIGQFGSILNGQSASPRYIYTKPSKFMRKMLRVEDDLILEHRVEEGVNLEPVNYFPILPLWLVNGVVGIGTGHSVKILPRDPKKISDLISKLAQGIAPQQKTIDDALLPYFGDWKGKVTKGDSDTQWEMTGVLEVVNTTTLRITELPVTYGVNRYKDILIGLMDKNIVKDFDNKSNEESFDFVVTIPREVGRKSLTELINIFKLVTKVGENVTLWNSKGALQRYESVYEALKEFVEFRLSKYTERKEKQLDEYQTEIDWLTAKYKFIEYWNTKLKDPHKKSEEELTELLSKVIDVKYVDRLLSLQISSLTMKKIDELKAQIEALKEKVNVLTSTSIETLYVTDLKSGI